MGRASGAGRAGRDHLELGFGFHIEAEDAAGDRHVDFGSRLADTGEHDLLGRNTGPERAQEFARRDDVGACAHPRERRDHRLIGIGFQRIADERVDIGESLGEDPVVPFQRRRRIAVEGRADLLGDRPDRHVLGMKLPVAEVEMVHRISKTKAEATAFAVRLA